MHALTFMVLAALVAISPRSPALASLPVPPCADDGQTVPGFAAVDEPPAILLETDESLLNDWDPPACLGWSKRPSDLIVALAARARAADIDEFLERFARVSSLEGMYYWSITRQSWRKMLDRAVALSAPERDAVRPDFDADDFVTGATLYVLHDDSEPLGPVIHEVYVREVSDRRVIVESHNVAPGRVLGVDILDPGGLENVTIIEHETGDIWRYYSVSRLQARIPGWLLPPSASYINRVVALYRHLSGVPTDGRAPVARRAEDVPG